MKKIIQYFTLLFCGILVLWACEKEINYDWADREPKLTMFGLITPTDTQLVQFANDSSWAYVPTTYIEISQSTSIFNTQRPMPLEGVKMAQFENGVFKDSIREFRQNGVFDIKGGFRFGQEYTIKASHPDYKNIEATVTIPDTVSIDSAIYDAAKRELTFSFFDPPGMNFYSFDISLLEGGSITFQTIDPDISTFHAELYDSILFPFSSDFITTGLTGYLKDDNFKGNKKTVKLLMPDDMSLSFKEIRIRLHSINYDYYELQRTFAAYYSTKDNPFAENVQIHSNVKNGLGLLGAKSSTYKIAIKK